MIRSYSLADQSPGYLFSGAGLWTASKKTDKKAWKAREVVEGDIGTSHVSIAREKALIHLKPYPVDRPLYSVPLVPFAFMNRS